MTVKIAKVPGFKFAHEIYEMQDHCFPGEATVQVDNTSDWWLAYVDDDIAGYASLSPSTSREYAGYLSHCGVKQEYRGMGLQRKLIRARIAQGKRYNWRTLVTDTTDNPKSANNLIACGFKLYTPKRPWGQVHTNYWRMSLDV